MDRARAAECSDGHDLRVAALFGDMSLRGRRHCFIYKVMDAPDRLDEGNAERLCNLFLDAAASGLLVELHRTAEEIVFIEIPQQKVGIGYARPCPPPAVADRPGVSTGALGAHLECAELAHLRYRAASRPDLHEVDDRDLDGEPAPLHEPLDAAHLEGRDDARDALLDKTRFCRGPAHVEAEHLRDIEVLAVILACYDGRSRPRFDDPDGELRGGIDGRDATRRQHDKELAGKADRLQAPGQFRQVTAGKRFDIRVRDRCARPFVFLDLRKDMV